MLDRARQGTFVGCCPVWRGRTILGVQMLTADPARSTALVAFGPTWLPVVPSGDASSRP